MWALSRTVRAMALGRRLPVRRRPPPPQRNRSRRASPAPEGLRGVRPGIHPRACHRLAPAPTAVTTRPSLRPMTALLPHPSSRPMTALPTHPPLARTNTRLLVPPPRHPSHPPGLPRTLGLLPRRSLSSRSRLPFPLPPRPDSVICGPLETVIATGHSPTRRVRPAAAGAARRVAAAARRQRLAGYR